MKILHIFDHSIPLQSGYTFRSRAIIREQQKLGWETVHITSSKQGHVDSLTEVVDDLLFYRSEELPAWQKKIPVLNQWFVIKKLEKRLKEVIQQNRPDIIHAHSPALNGIAAIKIAAQFSIPVVYEIRGFWEDAAVDHGTSKENGLRYKLTRALETYVIKKADAVITICDGLRKDIIDRGIAESKISIVPNAVDIEKFSVAQEKNIALLKQYNLSGKLVLGFVGSFYAYEGLSLLLNAIPGIKTQVANVMLLLVGGGPEEESLKHLVKDLNIEKNVVFTGRVAHEQVQSYYDLIDILVYPRLSMRLTELVTPLKPLEAMAQKKIFIASDVGGHKELIAHNVNGYLFNSNQVNKLEEAVKEVINNKDAWDDIKNNGRNFVEQERNWRVSIGNYSAVYNKLLDGNMQ